MCFIEKELTLERERNTSLRNNRPKFNIQIKNFDNLIKLVHYVTSCGGFPDFSTGNQAFFEWFSEWCNLDLISRKWSWVRDIEIWFARTRASLHWNFMWRFTYVRIRSTNASVNKLFFSIILAVQVASVKEKRKSFLTLTSFYLFRAHTLEEHFAHTLYNVSKKYWRCWHWAN